MKELLKKIFFGKVKLRYIGVLGRLICLVKNKENYFFINKKKYVEMILI